MVKLKAPHNLAFWTLVLKNEKEFNQFLTKGDQRQLECLRSVLQHLKKYKDETFDLINGKASLKRVNKRIQDEHEK